MVRTSWCRPSSISPRLRHPAARGMHMVQSGVVRAFGSDLRRVIGRTLRNRFAAISAGLVVTALLQSSTATAMMTTARLPPTAS